MTTEELERVSLIITTHDRSSFLEEAVAGARAQTYQNLDIVITDDGSTSTPLLRLLDRFEAEGIRVVRRPQVGLARSVNATVAESDSEFVMVHGDDDIIDPRYVEEAVLAATADPTLGIVYCRADFIGTRRGNWDLPDLDIGSILVDNQIFATALFRREDWMAVGGYDEAMDMGREDHDLILKILGLGRGAHRLEGTYFHYRQHVEPSRNAITGRSVEKRAAAHAIMFRNNRDLYIDHAEEFWLHFFRQLDEAKDLRLRYQHLERIRSRFPRLYGALRVARRGAESLGRRVRPAAAPTQQGTAGRSGHR